MAYGLWHETSEWIWANQSADPDYELPAISYQLLSSFPPEAVRSEEARPSSQRV